jgi:hypothetical protein
MCVMRCWGKGNQAGRIWMWVWAGVCGGGGVGGCLWLEAGAVMRTVRVRQDGGCVRRPCV